MIEEPKERLGLMGTPLALVLIVFFARLSYGKARTPRGEIISRGTPRA